ncbi:DUF3024 domain-containing protein [Paenibacillus polymyxa]
MTLIEERQAFRSEQWVQMPVAQFRLDEQAWKIYWQDSKGRWHFIDDIKPNVLGLIFRKKELES